MWSLLRSARHLGGYRRIVSVFTRHGLGWMVDRSGLPRLLSWPRRLFRRTPSDRQVPSLSQRLCRALEELGPAFVLLGRYLSARADLLPAELRLDLACLPEGGDPLASDEAGRIVEEELGRPLGEAFAEFESSPLRFTWLEQIHRARTNDGRVVLVAVPNGPVQSRLEQDRPLLQELARTIERRDPPALRKASEVAQDFVDALRQQIDARERGRNAERWQAAFAERGRPAFPQIDWERSTGRVLTCQALLGRPLHEIASAQPGQRDDLARALYRFFGEAIFEEGFFPLPPGLGRLVLLPDGRLAVSALAPAGHLDSATRGAIVRLLRQFQSDEAEEMITTGVALGLFERKGVGGPLQQMARHLIDRYHGLPLGELHLHEVAEDLFDAADRGTITLPGRLSQMLCTLVAMEELGRRLSSQVSPAEEMAPVLRRVAAAQYSWRARQDRLLRAGRAWLQGLVALPGVLHRLLTRARDGDLLIGVEPRGWRKPMRHLERMVTRVVLSVVASGLMIALALLITSLLPPSARAWGWALAGLAMFTLAGLGFRLFLSFLRRHDRY